MTKQQRNGAGWLLFVIGAAALSTAAVYETAPTAAQAQPRAERAQVRPRYASDGALRLPEDYRRWIFVGASLGLSYSAGQPGMEMFHETLMEPTAYQHFVDTGTFREGTMLALLLHSTGEGEMPARRGRFAADVLSVEMAVKDSSHRAEGWAYYNFGGRSGLRPTAQAMPKESCYNCHLENARRDNVFMQFYPLLAEAAGLSRGVDSKSTPTARQDATILALAGLDPVLLVEGREEKGKPEIVSSHGGYRYQFVSEPNRTRFESDPAKFSIQNSACLVVPGAPVDPSLVAVHDRRIYAFATSDCVDEFKRRPAEFIKR